MAQIPQTFNVADLPDTGGSMPLITPGKYPAVILDSVLTLTQDGAGQFLALKVILTGGQFAQTEFTERLNIINKSQVAVEIAYKTLARISEAVGMTQTPGDSSVLHNIPLMVEIGTEPGSPYVDKNGQNKQGTDKSIIKGWHSIQQAGMSAPSDMTNVAFGAAPAPAQGNVFTPPAATMPAPGSESNVAPAADNSTPWNKQ